MYIAPVEYGEVSEAAKQMYGPLSTLPYWPIQYWSLNGKLTSEVTYDCKRIERQKQYIADGLFVKCDPPWWHIEKTKTARGFNHVDLKCKYNQPFYIRQSSGDMNDVWLGIELFAERPEGTPVTMPFNEAKIDPLTGKCIATLLIDDKTFALICRARRMCRDN
jgi:hypothetical protein